MLHNMQLILL